MSGKAKPQETRQVTMLNLVSYFGEREKSVARNSRTLELPELYGSLVTRSRFNYNLSSYISQRCYVGLRNGLRNLPSQRT